MAGMRVLVTGGRKFYDKELVYKMLDSIHASFGISVLIHGGATGADQLGMNWAKSRGVHPISYEALWTHLGKAAGAERNRFMLEDSRAGLVIAFPGNEGTRDMISVAHAAKVEVIGVGFDAGVPL
jgi:hypothetical protein